ncbi:hypothetical protein [Alistipes sp.]|uniref:hypothetical protein n=1 Tax=Alistipes sp. TaxID=1872444 RepID=UPI003AB24924
MMRDNFSTKVKEVLAKRVGYRCSFPGCNRITIGPGHKSASDIVNLGEAAHIYAASPNGPRYDPSMTPEDRASINNGVWMCRGHAKIIDSDFTNYSAETIQQWKEIAENNTFVCLESLDSGLISTPTTLISIGSTIVFEGIWESANDGVWKFIIKKFLIGDIEDIRGFNDDIKSDLLRYIVIESQGDGRYIDGKLNWEFDNNTYSISINPKDKAERTTPYNMCDIAMNFDTHDIEIVDGSLGMVKGENCAKQTIILTLSSNFGDFLSSPTLGSYTSYYYWKYKDNEPLLKKLLKLEITRLISIPHKDGIDKAERPPLNFINRILDVDILSLDLVENKLPIKLKLEWGDGKIWEDSMNVFIKSKEHLHIK